MNSLLVLGGSNGPANGFTMADISLILKREKERKREREREKDTHTHTPTHTHTHTRDWVKKEKEKGTDGQRSLGSVSFQVLGNNDTPVSFLKKRTRRVNQNSRFHGTRTTCRERGSIRSPTRNRMNRLPWKPGFEIDSSIGPSSFGSSFLETQFGRNSGRDIPKIDARRGARSLLPRGEETQRAEGSRHYRGLAFKW